MPVCLYKEYKGGIDLMENPQKPLTTYCACSENSLSSGKFNYVNFM